MSFKVQPASEARLNRCQLFGPASNEELLPKMLKSAADVVNIDLEDSVSPDKKDMARRNAVAALRDMDWSAKTVSVRINGLDTPWWADDVRAVMEVAGTNLDLIMVPKVGGPEDLYAVDALMGTFDVNRGAESRVGMELIIETAAGLDNISAIAAYRGRLQAMSFGPADYAASMGMQTTAIGGEQRGYDMLGEDQAGKRLLIPADPWHQAIVSMVAACRANGLLPVDGPFGDFSNAEGYRAQAQRSAVLGCVGKWAIHPSQIGIANEVFSPSDEAVAKARSIIQAMKEAGEGATVLDGKLIDLASIRQAQVIVKQDELIEGAG